MSIKAPDPLNLLRHGGPEYRTAQVQEEAELIEHIEKIEAEGLDVRIGWKGRTYTPREAFEAYKKET